MSSSEKVAVLGAGGRTGRRIVEKALSAGHHVTAAVRSTERFPPLDAAADGVPDCASCAPTCGIRMASDR